MRLTVPSPKTILLRNLKEKYRGDQGRVDVVVVVDDDDDDDNINNNNNNNL